MRRLTFTVGLLSVITNFSCKGQDLVRLSPDIEKIQLSCFDNLTESEKKILFADKETRRKLMHSLNLLPVEEADKASDLLGKANPPWKYQDPVSYHIVGTVLNEVIESMKANGSEVKLIPPYATSYCFDVNADARKLGDDYVLFINHRLPLFCYQMTKAILAMTAIDTTDKYVSIEYRRQDLIRNLRNDTLLQKRFIEQLRYFHHGKKFKEYKLPELYSGIASTLTDAQEFFIVAHELNHALNRHDPEKEFPVSDSEIATPADLIVKRKRLAASWRNEILADIGAQRLLEVRSIQNKETMLGITYILGGMLFLTYQEILNKAGYIFENGKEIPALNPDDMDNIGLITQAFTSEKTSDSDYAKIDRMWLDKTHPPYRLRVELLSAEISSYLKEARSAGFMDEEKESFFKLTRNVLTVIDVLYSICTPRLIEISNHSNK